MENAATVNFYRNMALGAAGFYAVLTGALYYDSLTAGVIVSQYNSFFCFLYFAIKHLLAINIRAKVLQH